MALTIAPGDVFHLPYSRLDSGHVHIVITSVNSHTGAFLCVPIDSWKNPKLSDSTVILTPGDHPFISKKSFINYHESKILNFEIIEKLISEGEAQKMVPISPALLEKIRLGIKKSNFTKSGIIEFYVIHTENSYNR